MANIADDISHAYQDGYSDGYEKGKADAEFYLLHCGDTDEPPTNADRIRAMSDEELAERMSETLSEDCIVCPVLQADCPVWESKEVECKEAMLKWLKSPVKEEDDG